MEALAGLAPHRSNDAERLVLHFLGLVAEQGIGALPVRVPIEVHHLNSQHPRYRAFSIVIRLALAGFPAGHGHIAGVEPVCELLLGQATAFPPFCKEQPNGLSGADTSGHGNSLPTSVDNSHDRNGRNGA